MEQLQVKIVDQLVEIIDFRIQILEKKWQKYVKDEIMKHIELAAIARDIPQEVMFLPQKNFESSLRGLDFSGNQNFKECFVQQYEQYKSQQQQEGLKKQIDEIKESIFLQQQTFEQGQKKLSQTIIKQQTKLNLIKEQMNQIVENNIQNYQNIQDKLIEQKQNQANLIEQQQSFISKAIFTNCQQCLIQEIQQIKHELNLHREKIEQNIKKIDKTHAKIKSQEFQSKHNYQSHTPLNQKQSFVERMSIEGIQEYCNMIQQEKNYNF